MRLTRRVLRDIGSLIQRYSRYQQSILSIEQYTSFGKKAKTLDSYRFGKHEIPIRLAHIIREIDLLPKNLLKMPSVELVRSWYVQSFSELVEFEDENDDEETANRFTDMLAKIKQRHNNVVETMAQGIMELRERGGKHVLHPSIQYFLDRFYMNRIAIRMVITQHLMLFGHEAAMSSKSNFVGCFQDDCHVASIVEDAAHSIHWDHSVAVCLVNGKDGEKPNTFYGCDTTDAADNARYLCEQYYCASPELVITEHNAVDAKSHVTFSYLPAHLYHMLFELIKNAMRAVTENNPTSVEIPPVQVLITKGKQDLTIKISDRGGGISKSKIDEVFEYHYSTAPQPSASGHVAPLAGYGYGLPLSRLYAKYFDGDLQLYSMEGYGTDAVIWLKALSSDANEVLPVYNTRTPKNYEEVKAYTYPRDWSSSKFYGRTGTHRFLSTIGNSRQFICGKKTPLTLQK